MRQIILADQYNTNEIIQEEKTLWVRNLLLMLGLSEEELQTDNKNILFQHNLQVWDDLEHGDVEIMRDNILIGKWYAPQLHAKYDENNKLYYEIHLDYDSILDNEFNFVGSDE